MLANEFSAAWKNYHIHKNPKNYYPGMISLSLQCRNETREGLIEPSAMIWYVSYVVLLSCAFPNIAPIEGKWADIVRLVDFDIRA